MVMNAKLFFLKLLGLVLLIHFFNLSTMEPDLELGKRRFVEVKASDSQIVRVEHSLLKKFSKFEKHESRPIKLSSVCEMYCCGHDLECFLTIFSDAKKRKKIKNPDEAAAIVDFAEKLGAKKSLQKKLQAWSSGMATSSSSETMRDGCFDLSDKKIRTLLGLIKLKTPHTITTLKLSDNKIESFDLKSLLRLMPNLRDLRLCGNKISLLQPRMFEGMPQGFYLSLSHNPIKKMADGTIAALAKLRDKDISISLYDTELSQKEIHKIASTLAAISLKNRLIKIGMRTFAGCCLIGGILLKVYSHDDISEDDNSTVPVSTVQPEINDFMNVSATISFVLGPICYVAAEGWNFFKHSIKESRMFHF